MQTKYIVIVLCVLVTLMILVDARSTKKGRKHGRRCGDTRCKQGRRCATRYDGEKVCVCRERCRDNVHLICGSDGKTYTNYCHLHRSACLEDKHVTVLHQGPCLIEFSEIEREAERKLAAARRPLVCYQVQRDNLRSLLVDWLKTKVMEGVSYDDIVSETFKQCDLDSEGHLDGDELLKCTEKKSEEKDTSLHVLRGLCMDALINMGDHDNNWLLNEEEFSHILSLDFEPPTAECQLEDKNYTDGAQTQLECNTCVCACGNWVCTGAPCFKGKEMGVPGPVVEGHLPGPEETAELLNGFTASETVKRSSSSSSHVIKDEIVQELHEIDDKLNHM